ncbi:MAG: response regulator transcription factor [Burkholderiales bacterium]
MQVLVLDDHPIIHEIMKAVLEQALGPTTVHHESSLDAALERAAQLEQLDLVLLDLGLPGCAGLDALTRFRARFPRVPIVVLSADDTAATVRAALAAGASGYVPKTSSPALMQSAFRLVASGGIYIPPEALQPAPESAPSKPIGIAGLGLSKRQLEVLKRIAQGLANRQIADELDISENTVKHHTHEVFKALGVATRTEALVAAMRHGLRID